MAKRGADKELTKDNWDDAEDDEEAGHFKVASDENLIKRRMIKPKRRVPAGSEKATGNVFQGFTGFAGLNSNKAPSSSGLLSSKPLPGIKPLASGTTALTFSASKSSVAASNPLLMGTTATFLSGMSSNLNGNSASDANSSDAHLENVKALNISVYSWIKKHVDLNPYVDLTPIFHDYEKHMKSIDEKFLGAKGKKEAPVFTVLSSQGVSLEVGPATGATASFSFGRTESGTVSEKEPNKVQPEKESASARDDKQTEEDSVPKPEKVINAEEGAFHSIRCKLFFKRDSSWSELGLGMLNLKKLEEKTQLLIRNDTTLGKVLLNVLLSANMPISRSGKNNVMLVCVPNPPLYSKESEGDNSKPAMYLIRVKTAENADELFEQLNSNKPAAT